MIELLSPAGNKDAFLAAINNGANAVYLGLKKFSARGNADNFNEEDLKYCVNYAKLFGVKVYAAVNTLVKNDELQAFFEFIGQALSAGVDAVILQDMFLGKTLKEIFPNIVLHLSTQAGVCNILGAKIAKEYGFSRVILARETKMEDIREIAAFMETEVFVQGALCSSFSGHCYMSSFIGGNSGNRGLCKQPCRKKYSYIINGKEQRECYALSLSDLCVGNNIDKLIEAGVHSFKIEGRMRRKEYVGAATRYYRLLIDEIVGQNNGENSLCAMKFQKNEMFHGMFHENNVKDLISDAESALKRAFNRNNYTKGLAFGQKDDFLSTRVQGHIGEKVGVIERKIANGLFLVSGEVGEVGDAYKILRNGAEIGSGIFKEAKSNGFILQSSKFGKTSAEFLKGDEVRITTDVKIERKITERQKKLPLEIFAILSQNARARFLILLDNATCASEKLSSVRGEQVNSSAGFGAESDNLTDGIKSSDSIAVSDLDNVDREKTDLDINYSEKIYWENTADIQENINGARDRMIDYFTRKLGAAFRGKSLKWFLRNTADVSVNNINAETDFVGNSEKNDCNSLDKGLSEILCTYEILKTAKEYRAETDIFQDVFYGEALLNFVAKNLHEFCINSSECDFEKRKKLTLSNIKKLIINYSYFVYEGNDFLPCAVNQAVDKKAVDECFSKTGEYPFGVVTHLFTNGVFMPKSKLNEMRRVIFEKSFLFYAPSKNTPIKYILQKNTQIIPNIISYKNICILQKISDINMSNIKIVIYLPADYNDLLSINQFLFEAKKRNIETFLFLPGFASGDDLKILQKVATGFDGIYADSYYGIKFGKMLNKKIFAGFGLNIFNEIDFQELAGQGVLPENIALSKELSIKEIDHFKSGAYLAQGNISVMEFIYCPFGKKCAGCEKNNILLKDDCGRIYNVLKYKLSECRFIVYNPYDLLYRHIDGKGEISDFTFRNKTSEKTNGNRLKGVS